MSLRRFAGVVGIVLSAGTAAAMAQSFVNWENPHVHPLDLTPDRSKLLAVNTADNRLEVFDVTSARPVPIGSVAVGLDPVSVRARSNTQAWVVNHISDSVSIVDLISMNVIATISTDDEPADVVFAGTPQRAFVSCSQANTVLVLNPDAPAGAPLALVVRPGVAAVPPQPANLIARIPIVGDEPRAMAVSADGSKVYVAIFESGNRSTILAGGAMNVTFGTSPVDDPFSPYFDPGQDPALGINPQNPPPNSGTNFNPPKNPANPGAPRVGLIVKKNPAGQWMDDNAHEWTQLVSGPNAANSGRPIGWDLADHDVAVIDAATLVVNYASGLMNICMALAVNPGNGRVTVVGTNGINEVRYEPLLRGRFLRVNFASFDPATVGNNAISDLNPHLSYPFIIPFVPIPQPERERSIGDPRGIVWNAAGTRGYVTGMGSNNLVPIGPGGVRATARPLRVGEGPTGVVLDEPRNRVYVLNKFSASISVVDTGNNTELLPRVSLYDPTPGAIKTGRKHLYDTHLNSGLGHQSCASCHVDARFDKLSWDLGDPSGEVKDFNQNCNAIPGAACNDWHPMKGPMTTQTLQDIIGNEPHHWRGDRDGIEEFANAFRDLLGDDQPLVGAPMQEFENFLATITIPPNPFRNFDNSLPLSLNMPGHFATGRFFNLGGLPAGAPLPNGNAVAGLGRYVGAPIDGGLKCVTCHALPTGMGPDGVFVLGPQGPQFQPLPPGPNGEHHIMTVSADGSTNRTIKVPHLRNQYEKTGFDTTQTLNTAGFGLLHDGSVDSITRFISLPAFAVENDQVVANLVAFMLAFAGSELPEGDPLNPLEPPGVPSLDTHAGVGWQTTVVNGANPPPGQLALINDMIEEADDGVVGVVVKGKQGGVQRGYAYIGSNQFQADRLLEVVSRPVLIAGASLGNELTFTVVPEGSEVRIGIDRDEDGHFDRDELDGCSNPADASSVPPQCVCQTNADCDDGDPCNGEEVCLPDHTCQNGPIVPDCNSNGVVDSCELDCNDNGVPDQCDIASGTSDDTNHNAIPDECDPACGGIASIPCGVDEFCETPIGQCCCDITGVCTYAPPDSPCTDEVDPVCGCDGDTYFNECAAEVAHVSIAHRGECETACAPAEAVLPDPSGFDKNRYLSFIPRTPGRLAAIRVTLVNLDGFAAFNGQTRWVGAPQAFPEGPAGGTFMGATMQCLPECRNWAGVGLLHAYGAEVVPNSFYEVQMIDCGCDLGDEGNYSGPLAVNTALWGDVVAQMGGDSQPNFLDIAAIVAKFTDQPGAPIKARAQLQPNVPNPGSAINFLDVSFDVDAFRGFGYPFAGPVICP